MKNEIIISKMLGYIEKIEKYSANMSYEDFMKNDLIVEACVFNLSQMGELANKLDETYREKYSNIAWKQIYGLRNRIVHDYEGVNLKLVWEIIEYDLPELKEKLSELKQLWKFFRTKLEQSRFLEIKSILIKIVKAWKCYISKLLCNRSDVT